MPDEYIPFARICERCKQQKDVIDMSDNPIHTTSQTRESVDINIICVDCLRYYLDRMRKMMGEEIA